MATVLPTFLCLVVIFLAACKSDTLPPNPHMKASPDKQIFMLPQAVVSDIRTLDPALSAEGTSISAVNMVYTGLVSLNDQLQVVPQMATWDVSADQMTYTFHLKNDLKFSDGTQLRASDVAYSIDRALQPATKSNTGPYYLRYIKDADKLAAGTIKTIIGDSIKTPDPSTVIITAKKPVAFFLDALTFPCSYIVEKSLVQKYGSPGFTNHLQEGGGAGPFTLAEHSPGKRIVFVPNPHYYGPHPQLQKVIFPFYRGLDSIYKAYLSDVLDKGFISTADYAQARTRSDFHSVPQLWIQYYTMNYLTKPFDNIAIRQAFALAINKDALVHAAWRDSLLSTNHIVPDGIPGFNSHLTGPGGVTTKKGDPARARQLLKIGMQQEGWASVSQIPPITLSYASSSVQAYKNEVAILQQDWQTVLGISVKVEDIDYITLLTDIVGTTNKNTLQFWGSNWIADYPDPQNWTTLQFGKGAGQNNMNYGQNTSTDAVQQQQVQQALEQADINQNTSSRLQAYEQAEQQLVNDVAWIPMEQVTTNYLLKPCVVGYVLNRQGLTPPDDWGHTYISTATPCADTTGQ